MNNNSNLFITTKDGTPLKTVLDQVQGRCRVRRVTEQDVISMIQFVTEVIGLDEDQLIGMKIERLNCFHGDYGRYGKYPPTFTLISLELTRFGWIVTSVVRATTYDTRCVLYTDYTNAPAVEERMGMTRQYWA